MIVHPIPALSDNYMYLLIDSKSNVCAAVDPVEPQKILNVVNKSNLKLIAVLTTHHHWDHAGGNNHLAAQLPGLKIYGGDERIDSLNAKVHHNQIINVGSLIVKCLFTPCHTKGHMCFYVQDNNSNEPAAVFTGDTLFVSGCGRFFEGTAEQMYEALTQTLGTLPEDTLVYCGHEYTYNNLLFASYIEPDNQHLLKKLEWAKGKQRKNEFTVPSSIKEELLTNCFMRVHHQSILNFFGTQNPIHAMKMLRAKKDNFTPPS
ncbi:hypothetical protein HELRODRAFT_155548 [Helobdella robusta]|uniref:hydroxyacylglutathione hydrolase n=1 Tax=Helobdella robusta TaxID=6412 RepID=T1ELI7_HELRO|nr:hypothetical protein HELRODRAFT_155548 [Helobdella robusta]ESO12034.1 hypothetical protein HELRODRAFT_155548 [Helobdella robusta]